MSVRRRAKRKKHNGPEVPPEAEYCQTTNKVCYSKRQAKKAIKLMRRPSQQHHETELLKVYRCPFCDYYHIGRDRKLAK